MKPFLFVFLVLFVATAIHADGLSDAALREIRFDQKPGDQISADLPFVDENGRSVKLGAYFGSKPVILVPGYYGCPMLCTLVLNGLVETLQDLKSNVGDQFTVINFSIDPSEKPDLAASKKSTYLRHYARAGAEGGWHFLTGDEAAIRKLSDEIGFHYVYDPAVKQYAHPSGFVVMTPQGRIARYFFGVDFQAKDVNAALTSASENQTGSSTRQLLLLCFHYSPVTSKYGSLILNCVRGCGVVTLAGLGVMIGRCLMRDWKRKT